MSEILAKHIKPVICDICYSPVTEDIVGLTCCGILIHGECINTNANYTHSCPHCDCYYAVDSKNHILTYIMNHCSSDDIVKLYHDIYNDNPKLLRQVDRMIRMEVPKLKYLAKFVGYFDYMKICPDKCNLEKFRQSWDTFTYGIFRDYDWKHTFATGRAVATMFNQNLPDDADNIYIVVYNSDYRIVRKQLQNLFSHLESVLGEPLIHIEEGILVLFFSCLVRKICIYVEYNADPYWFIFQKRNKFGAYGTIYNGTTIYCTVKALVSPKEYKITDECDVLKYVRGNESNEKFMQRTKTLMVVGTKYIMENIYQDYHLIVSHGPNVDPLKKKLLVALVADLHDIIDVKYCEQADTDDINLALKTHIGTIPINTTIMTKATIRQVVLRKIYQQPLSMI